MLTVNELSRAIHKYIANKQFSEALDYFKKNKNEINPTEISKNEFLIADILTALRGIRAFDAAYQFLAFYNIPTNTQSSVRLLNSYGWLLYFQYKTENNLTTATADTNEKVKPESEQTKNGIQKTNGLEKRIEVLLALLKNTTDTYSTNLVEYLFKLIMHTEKGKATTNWYLVEKICKLIDKQKLSISCANIQVERKGQQKEMELASAREEWYAMYSKALYEAGNYSACREICEQGLKDINKMHYSNEIWFERRIAQCDTNCENYEAAINKYLQLIPKKHDWFMLKELCACYNAVGNFEKAMLYGQQAATAYGPINFKVELIELLGDIVQKQNNPSLALKHYRLAQLIREAEKWQVDKALTEKIAMNRVTADEISENKEKLKAELILFWNDTKKENSLQKAKTNTENQPLEIITGKITKLLATKATGIDGFVKSDSGSSAYFFIPLSSPLFGQLKIGVQVQYELQTTLKGDKAIKVTAL